MSRRAVELACEARTRGLVCDWNGAPGLGALLITGPDAGSFLQSQLTSDVASLGPGDGQLSARVDCRGRLEAWFSLHHLPDRGQAFPLYLIVLPRREAVGLREILLASMVSEDLTIDDVSDECSGVILQGPCVLAPFDASEAWSEGGVINLTTDFAPTGSWAIRRSLTGDPGVLVLWFSNGDDDESARVSADLLQRTGSVFFNDDDARLAWRWLTIEAGRPEMGRDLAPGQRILSQTGLEHETVSWTKGCYLGQEVLARVKAYGSPPESLRGLVFPGSGPFEAPDTGESLTTIDGEDIGTWAAAGFSPAHDAPLALAFLRRRHTTPGKEFDLKWNGGHGRAVVTLLPIHRAGDPVERAVQSYDRAVARFRDEDDHAAVALLEDALIHNPSHRDALEALGVILGRLHRYQEGIEIFRRLERVAPDDSMVNANLSLYFMKLGDKDEAERQKAVGTMKRFGVTAEQAEASADQVSSEHRAREDEIHHKLAMFEEVIEIDPGDPLALMGAGDALMALGHTDLAIVRLAAAQRAQPDNSAIYLKHGRALEILDLTAEAAVVYRAGVAIASRRGDFMPLRDMEHRLVILQAAIT